MVINMKARKIIYLIMGCAMILLVGCVSQNTKDIDLGNIQQDDSSNHSKEGISEQDSTEIPVIVSGDEVNEMMNNSEKAYVIVGGFETEKYNLLLENMIKVCEERDMEVYALNSADEKNTEWLEQNNITAEMNVAILSSGRQTIWDLQYEEEYQSELLGSMLAGIMGKMDELIEN